MPNVYPPINAAGIITQFPYTEMDEFVITTAQMENGFSNTAAINTLPLKRFMVRYPLIQRDEVKVLEDFWVLMRGEVGEFQFTDDHGTVWEHTRFAMSEFLIKYNEPNSHSVDVQLSAEAN